MKRVTILAADRSIMSWDASEVMVDISHGIVCVQLTKGTDGRKVVVYPGAAPLTIEETRG